MQKKFKLATDAMHPLTSGLGSCIASDHITINGRKVGYMYRDSPDNEIDNHVHLLCTPRVDNAVSQMMQSLGRQYVRYFNHSYLRTGTLWEGRFKSCLVQQETHLLEVYRYIELNPVRAGMVEQPSDYRWSSYPINALGKISALCTPHPLYLSLGSEAIERQSCYRELFKYQIDEKRLDDIRLSINKNRGLGDERFAAEVEILTGQRMVANKMGRPVGGKTGNIG